MLAANSRSVWRRYSHSHFLPPLVLPPQTPDFVGREPELDALCARLLAGQSMSLSAVVVGMGAWASPPLPPKPCTGWLNSRHLSGRHRLRALRPEGRHGRPGRRV